MRTENKIYPNLVQNVRVAQILNLSTNMAIDCTLFSAELLITFLCRNILTKIHITIIYTTTSIFSMVFDSKFQKLSYIGT